jgi:hypothetical protein
MSEFYTENPQLYEELGLGILLQEGVSDSLPVHPLEGYETPLDVNKYADLFAKLEASSPLEYEGLKKSASMMALAIETNSISSEHRTNFDIPLLPHRSQGIYDHEQTQATYALRELAYRMTGAEVMADETTLDFPVGRVWLQGKYRGMPINFIEDHAWESNGHLLKLSVVADVPRDIVDSIKEAPEPVYPPETARAIAISKKLHKISERRIHQAREAELDYFLFVRDLPTAKSESPYDKAA